MRFTPSEDVLGGAEVPVDPSGHVLHFHGDPEALERGFEGPSQGPGEYDLRTGASF